MTSILTNSSANGALQTLRSINFNLNETQQQVSSGLRVRKAADDVAYWSISTTMRSDMKAVSAVSDALGVGAAKVDTAYAGLDAVNNVLSEFKAKLVTAEETSVDKAQVQNELDQLKAQVVSIAQGASFSGENWLNTDIEDINDSDLDVATVVSSFTRDADGGVSVNMAKTHLAEVSLFNSTGGGLLQSDNRHLGTLGGIRNYDTFMDTDGTIWTDTQNLRQGLRADLAFTFSGPLTFDDAGDAITFDVTVDADDQSVLDGPYEDGKTTSISITRATLDAYDAAYSAADMNGTISTYDQYISVLSYALGAADADASAHYYSQYDSATGGTKYIENKIGISTSESSGLNGSYVEISNLTSTVGTGGLAEASAYGTRAQQMTLDFSPFEVYKDGDEPEGVTVGFDFHVNGQAAKHYSFDRSYVNDLLGKDTGKVETADEMVTLLQSLMSADWPDVTIANDGSGNITVSSETDVDRLQGAKTSIGFDNINVSIEPISETNFLDIDIDANPDMLDAYITYIDQAQSDVTNAQAVLGALTNRIDLQSSFAGQLMDSVNEGVSRLVDVDMEDASTRLAALQTQQQLALQSLTISNSGSDVLMQLFQ